MANFIGYSEVKRYYYECQNSDCTVGCCSLSSNNLLFRARYLAKIGKLAKILSKIFTVEQVTSVINEVGDRQFG